MAINTSEQQQPQQQSNNHSGNKQKSKANQDQLAVKRLSPMIVDRFYRYSVVNMAVNLGYQQYDKLKTSNVTVGEVMTKVESVASYFWQKVLPIVEKFQEPISKADQLACDTLDFVENKLSSREVSPQLFR